MPRGDDLLHLLLAHAGDRTPALPDGLPLAAALAPSNADPWRAAPPQQQDPASGDVPDDVPMGPPGAPPAPPPPPPPLWGIVAPEGPEGDRLIALVDKLIRLREEQQRAPAPIHRVPKIDRPWTISDAIRWRRERYDSGAALGRDRAVHQLILGDLGQVPLVLQEVQAMDGDVGRIAFDDDAGYEAYVDKILRAERAPRRGPGRLVMHTAHDGSRALDIGSQGLAAPGEATLRAEIEKYNIPTRAFLSHAEHCVPGMDLLLERAADPSPGALFTLSHGLGAPAGGWSSLNAQCEGQGAMAFGFEGELRGSDIAARSFMPNGLWLMFACFGAGTPDASAYAKWLTRMEAFGRRAPDVKASLSRGAPFIADLPQRALASPNGPLGFIGHVDLAWTFSFRDDDEPSLWRAGRFMRVLASALAGEPFGKAFHELARFVREKDTELAGAYTSEPASGGTPIELKRALLWMARQDLAGFILLGDPAARLPIGEEPVAVGMEPPTPAGGDAMNALERAIGAALAGNRSIAEVAAAHGVDADSLARAVAAYRAAGRRALGLDG